MSISIGVQGFIISYDTRIYAHSYLDVLILLLTF
jgi:hypothetical protein